MAWRLAGVAFTRAWSLEGLLLAVACCLVVVCCCLLLFVGVVCCCGVCLCCFAVDDICCWLLLGLSVACCGCVVVCYCCLLDLLIYESLTRLLKRSLPIWLEAIRNHGCLVHANCVNQPGFDISQPGFACGGLGSEI